MDKNLRDKRTRKWKPKKEQLEQIEKLYQIGCTKKEIYSIMKISQPTYIKWCNENKELVDSFKNDVKRRLRKVMIDNAINENNTQMQIHLSKHYLGMNDKLETHNTNVEIPTINIIEDK